MQRGLQRPPRRGERPQTRPGTIPQLAVCTKARPGQCTCNLRGLSHPATPLGTDCQSPRGSLREQPGSGYSRWQSGEGTAGTICDGLPRVQRLAGTILSAPSFAKLRKWASFPTLKVGQGRCSSLFLHGNTV